MFVTLPIDCPSVSTSIYLTLLVLVCYQCITWYRRYTSWATLYDGIPGKTQKHWFFGHIHEHPGPSEDGIEYQVSWTEDYPKLHTFWFGKIRCVVVVHHPDTVRKILKASAHIAIKPCDPGTAYMIGLNWLGEGLLIANGERWARNRRLLTPAFHFDILKQYMKIYNQCTDTLLNKIERFAQMRESFEVFQHVGLCSLDIISRCTFSYQTDCQTQGENHPYVQAVHTLSELWVKRAMRIHEVFDFVYFNLTRDGKEFLNLCNFVHGVSEEIIAKRKDAIKLHGLPNENDSSKRSLDFLDIILTAKDEDGNGLTDLEIRNEVDTFLFEGHDTTTSAISFIMYELARNPDIQELCRAEIDDILKDGDTDIIEWKDLGKMDYLTQCIKEGLRLHCPVFYIQRQLTESVEVEGHSIPSGTIIALDIFNLHHNKSVWGDDVNEFKPDRFSLDNINKMDPFAFLPFSAGQRNCIGQNFAMNEIKVMVASLINRYKFTLKPGHVMRRRMSVVMRTEDGVWLQAEPRQKII